MSTKDNLSQELDIPFSFKNYVTKDYVTKKIISFMQEIKNNAKLSIPSDSPNSTSNSNPMSSQAYLLLTQEIGNLPSTKIGKILYKRKLAKSIYYKNMVDLINKTFTNSKEPSQKGGGNKK